MSISGSAYSSADVAYDYDGAYQLTKETRTDGDAYTQSFWYDCAGNRTKKTIGGTPTEYEYDYIDRMTTAGGTTLDWDYWGNMTAADSHAYSWDDVDHLTKFDHETGPVPRKLYQFECGYPGMIVEEGGYPHGRKKARQEAQGRGDSWGLERA